MHPLIAEFSEVIGKKPYYLYIVFNIYSKIAQILCIWMIWSDDKYESISVTITWPCICLSAPVKPICMPLSGIGSYTNLYAVKLTDGKSLIAS